MSPSDKKPTRIPAADVGLVLPWQLPRVQGEHLVALVQRQDSAVEEQLEPEEQLFGGAKLTLAELERITEEARQEGLEEGHREGLAKGLEEGQRKGYSEGLAQGKLEIDRSLGRLSQMLDELEAPLAQQSEALELCILNLVTSLARAVTGHELSSQPQLMLQAVQEALAQLPSEGGAVRIHVNPEDEVLLQPLAQAREHCELVADAAISPGGCLVKTANCQVDSRVETRFRQAADQLLSRLADSRPETPPQ
ncbi:flagellar assembly protein FliH [Marinobacterium rhizophilum]|uniref:Flagellar assembly protein FliH n=1 Tax=Marinobacterium rhizophilum TaxID=420402 RepID=A0ABY5HCF7_9GAMM|nr:flagellar assembly protein FliH [Marinobacterium rhizophilum]UTW10033.1 flagellar assembly protein FliH [Marinobacterium rhizophilum]